MSTRYSECRFAILSDVPVRGALGDAALVRRLHDRLGLGATRPDLDAGIAAGVEATVAKLLITDEPAPTSFPDLPAIKDAPAGDPRKSQELQRSDQEQTATLWWLDRIATVKAPRAEKMTWFWHGHFATSNEKVRDPQLMLTQNQTFRTAGQDSFAALAQRMVVDPALNLGREFLELFTLGVGEYSESDVRQAARALTGWTYKDRELTFAKNKFDDGPKSVLGATADVDAAALVDMLTARPDSARFIATRLWSRLVSTDPPSESDLERLTDAYGPGTSIPGLLRALATSPAFRARRWSSSPSSGRSGSPAPSGGRWGPSTRRTAPRRRTSSRPSARSRSGGRTSAGGPPGHPSSRRPRRSPGSASRLRF